MFKIKKVANNFAYPEGSAQAHLLKLVVRSVETFELTIEEFAFVRKLLQFPMEIQSAFGHHELKELLRTEGVRLHPRGEEILLMLTYDVVRGVSLQPENTPSVAIESNMAILRDLKLQLIRKSVHSQTCSNFGSPLYSNRNKIGLDTLTTIEETNALLNAMMREMGDCGGIEETPEDGDTFGNLKFELDEDKTHTSSLVPKRIKPSSLPPEAGASKLLVELETLAHQGLLSQFHLEIITLLIVNRPKYIQLRIAQAKAKADEKKNITLPPPTSPPPSGRQASQSGGGFWTGQKTTKVPEQRANANAKLGDVRVHETLGELLFDVASKGKKFSQLHKRVLRLGAEGSAEGMMLDKMSYDEYGQLVSHKVVRIDRHIQIRALGDWRASGCLLEFKIGIWHKTPTVEEMLFSSPLSRRTFLDQFGIHYGFEFEGGRAEALLQDLLRACDSGDVPVFMKVFHRVPPNPLLAISGVTPLQLAVARGHEQMVDYLLHMKAHPDTPFTETLETPLMVACQLNHVTIVELLLAFDANPNLKDLQGYARSFQTVYYLDSRLSYLFS